MAMILMGLEHQFARVSNLTFSVVSWRQLMGKSRSSSVNSNAHPQSAGPAGDPIRSCGSTEFSVKAMGGGKIETAVRRGRVDLQTREPTGISVRDLEAGDVATVGAEGTTIQNVGPAEIERRLAWTDRMLDLDGPLADAVAEFNRYNVRKLKIAGEALGQLSITGRFSVTDPEGFVEALSRLGVKHVVVTSNSPSGDYILLTEGE
jgi:hypothetical protein